MARVREAAPGGVTGLPGFGLPALRFSKSLCYMADMESGHAAALALVGWYLMMPPLYWSKANPPTAPLRQWTVFGRYDSAQEGSDERTKMIRVQSMALLSDLAEGVSDANRPSLSLDFKHAQCITSDDPRLKENSAPVSFAR